ncbi:hypothetical protein [Ornithinibacillus sp. 179-J 7C1 HS]|uniref:hypothetical protein n=1 Tax=Ornithinibacillus sp. 179-J 7C1 HS TaxID=3142384 RepID=UPI0039A0F90E
MIKRKIVTTLLATPMSLIVIFAVFFGEWKQPFELVTMTAMFSIYLAPFIILYAIPVTFLSDYVGRRFVGNVRVSVAFMVHLVFGVLFGFIFPSNASFSLYGVEIDTAIIFASITALLFWTIDELLRKNNFQETIFSKCCLNFAK